MRVAVVMGLAGVVACGGVDEDILQGEVAEAPFADGKADGMDVADRAGRIVLVQAKLDGCVRSNCLLSAAVDVRWDVVDSGAEVFLLHQNAVGSNGSWSTLAAGGIGEAPAGYQRFMFQTQVIYNPMELIPFFDVDGHRVFDHNRTEGNYRLDSAHGNRIDPDDVYASVISRKVDLPDAGCRIVLAGAKVDGCVHSNCWFMGTVDVRSELAPVEVFLRYEKTTGLPGQWVSVPMEQGPAAFAGFDRWVFKTQIVSNPVTFIPYLVAGSVSLFDHNRVEGDYRVVTTPIVPDDKHAKCVGTDS